MYSCHHRLTESDMGQAVTYGDGNKGEGEDVQGTEDHLAMSQVQGLS